MVRSMTKLSVAGPEILPAWSGQDGGQRGCVVRVGAEVECERFRSAWAAVDGGGRSVSPNCARNEHREDLAVSVEGPDRCRIAREVVRGGTEDRYVRDPVQCEPVDQCGRGEIGDG